MRRALGVALGLCGLATGLVAIAVTLWATHQYTTGIARNGIAHFVALILVSFGCVAGSYALLRRQPPA